MTEEPHTIVRETGFLSPRGELTAALPSCVPDSESLLPLYRHMVLTRCFDARCIALQRTGRLGTYASCLGQEAIGTGVAHVMQAEDVLLPSYREHAAQLLRGVTMEELLLYWGGDERGSDFALPREDFPVSIPIATQCTHAAGVATAFKVRGQPRVAVVICGDGATSKGDFYEAVNLAGVWQLPLVFVVANNQWAISVPRTSQSGAETLAQKAIAGGFSGEQVDGNDVIAVVEAMGRALQRARAGDGPSLIECVTYRLGDHTTADDASRYRDGATVAAHKRHDPVVRARLHLERAEIWDDSEEATLQSQIEQEVETSVKRYLERAPQTPESMFDHLHDTPPAALWEQRDEVVSDGGAHE